MGDLHYDPPDGTYRSSASTGILGLNHAVLARYRTAQTIQVVRDRDRCAAQDSRHCQGAAADFFPITKEVGDRLADDLVAHAADLGVQGVVWFRRRWGFGRWEWRAITSGHMHEDHVHYELTKHAATTLTEARARVVLAGRPPPSQQPEEGDLMFIPRDSTPVNGKHRKVFYDPIRHALVAFLVDVDPGGLRTDPDAYGVRRIYLPDDWPKMRACIEAWNPHQAVLIPADLNAFNDYAFAIR